MTSAEYVPDVGAASRGGHEAEDDALAVGFGLLCGFGGFADVSGVGGIVFTHRQNIAIIIRRPKKHTAMVPSCQRIQRRRFDSCFMPDQSIG